MKLLVVLCVFIGSQAKAQSDTVAYNKTFNSKLIPMGTFNYELFLESNGIANYNGKMKRVITGTGDLITAAVEFRSYNGDTVYSSGISTINAKSLMPVRNISERNKMKITTTFAADSIRLSLVDSSGNTRAASLKPATDAFDFEIDYETFAALPLWENGKYTIPFYQPGTRSQPKYYSYEVTGSESVTIDNKNYDCWVLYSSSYQSGLCTFWVRKKDHLIIKEQRVRKDGTKSGKIIKLG